MVRDSLVWWLFPYIVFMTSSTHDIPSIAFPAAVVGVSPAFHLLLCMAPAMMIHTPHIFFGTLSPYYPPRNVFCAK